MPREVKNIGYVGRVLCRATGSFDVVTSSGRVAGISHKYCQPIHRKDGYLYANLEIFTGGVIHSCRNSSHAVMRWVSLLPDSFVNIVN